LFDRDKVKQRVRRGFLNHIVTPVGRKEKELVLHYTNHDKATIYATYPIASLESITVKDLISSIPCNNNGPKDGAAFPITLLVDTQEVLDDTEDGTFL
jgi:hypothetical protein